MALAHLDRRNEYDPARLLICASLWFVGLLILFVGAIIGVQIYKNDEANTESWAALTGLIGWATSQVSIVFSNRFGNTQQAAKKDEVIVQQSKAATALAAAATGQAPPPVAPQKTDEVVVHTENTTVVEQEKPK